MSSQKVSGFGACGGPSAGLKDVVRTMRVVAALDPRVAAADQDKTLESFVASSQGEGFIAQPAARRAM